MGDFLNVFNERLIRGKITAAVAKLVVDGEEILVRDMEPINHGRSYPERWYGAALKALWGPFLRQGIKHGGWVMIGTRLNGSSDTAVAKKVGRKNGREKPDDINLNVVEIDIHRAGDPNIRATISITVVTMLSSTTWWRAHGKAYLEERTKESGGMGGYFIKEGKD